MKVQIAHTLQVTDVQLVQLANLNDDKRTKRRAKREEVKDWIWRCGATWADDLNDSWVMCFGEGDPMAGAAGAKADTTDSEADASDLEDLIGYSGSSTGPDYATDDLKDLL